MKLLLRLISHSHHLKPTPKPSLLRHYTTPSTHPQQPTNTSPLPPPPSPKISSIADEIASLTLLEVSDLTTLLSKKLEVKDMPLVSLMMPGMGFSLPTSSADPAAGKNEEKSKEEKKERSSFDLKLEGFDAGAKIKIIKEVRTFTDLGLKEAKELVEKAPAVLKTGVAKEEAENIVEKMKALGATVVLE